MSRKPARSPTSKATSSVARRAVKGRAHEPKETPVVRLPRARLAAACASIVLVAATILWWPSPTAPALIAATVDAPSFDVGAVPVPTTLPPSPSTTITAPPPASPARRPVAVARPVVARTVSAGHPCGGDLPPCWVMMRESKGDPTAINWHGCVLPDGRRGCFGKWQDDWNAWPPGYLGYARADLAPEALQDQRAREMWNHGHGCSHWAAC